ncbi:hypothetical protein BHM03_00049161 [Ensete ventricosum]|nr:hypothetical protein BHM03_00049161 [Ensete ventricosum]
MDSSSVVLAHRTASDWWDEVNNSTLWQDRIFHALSVLFGLISAVALVIFFRVGFAVLLCDNMSLAICSSVTGVCIPSGRPENEPCNVLHLSYSDPVAAQFVLILANRSVSFFAALGFLLYGGR